MFHSTDVSPALGNITPKQTTEPDKTSHNSILKSVLTVIRYICFLPYPYLLTVLANCISSYDINTISFLIENRTGAFYFGFIITSVLFISLCFICSRAWLAGSILGICYTTLALVDNIKFSILQEHLLPWDLLLSKNIEDFQPFLKTLHITPVMILLLLSPVLYSVLLLPRKPKYFKKYFHLITIILGIATFTGTAIFLTNNTMRMSYTKWFDI